MRNVSMVGALLAACANAPSQRDEAPASLSGDPVPIVGDPTDPEESAFRLPPQPDLDQPAATDGEPVRLPAGTADGRPHGVDDEAAPPAFWIWRDDRGVWKLRTTTGGRAVTWWGRVHGEMRPITRIKASREDLRDQLGATDGGTVIFKFATDTHRPGFDFKVKDDGCAVFDLRVDLEPASVDTELAAAEAEASSALGEDAARPTEASDEPALKRIFVGSNEIEPTSSHFAVCP